MIRRNYHTHTFRCGHAIGNDEDYVLEAIGLGLQTIGFSDHVMLEHIHHPNVRGDFILTEGYFNSIRRLKHKYRERINVLLGFEAEAFEEYFDYFCGIHGNYLKRVNQQKFAPLFKKYKPMEFGME